MSIPGDQNNPYARPQQPQGPYQGPAPMGPQTSAQPQPGAPTQPGGYGPGGPAGATSAPEMAGTGAFGAVGGVVGPGGPVGASGPAAPMGPVGPVGPSGPGNGGGQRGRIPGWVWGVGGAVLASAVWGAAVIVNGGFHSEPSADLAGYQFHQDMCDVVDTGAFKEHYVPSDKDAEKSAHSTHAAQDVSTCSLRFKRDNNDDDYDDYETGYSPTAYVDFSATWHKRSDPRPEFEAQVKGRHQLRDTPKSKFNIVDVDEVGEEAFLSTESKEDGPLTGATLSIRDGWVEVQLTWYSYTTSRNREQLSEGDVKKMLVKSAQGTLTELKKPSDDPSPNPSESNDSDDADDSDGPGDSGGSGPGSEDSEEPPKRGDGDI